MGPNYGVKSSSDRDPLNLAEWLQRRRRDNPNAPAILAPGRPALSYAGLYEQVCLTAAQLQNLGFGRRDRLALVLDGGPEAATAFLAISTFAACAPLNPAYQSEEFSFYLRDLKATALVVGKNSRSPAVEAARQLGLRVLELVAEESAGKFRLSAGSNGPAGFAGQDDIALLLHTSGTTSRPKLVPLTQRNLLSSARNIAESLALSPADGVLNIMPLFHVHGLVGALLATIQAGASIVCTPGFQAGLVPGWMREFAPTWYTAVPAMHQSILAQLRRDPAALSGVRLRFIRSCSAPLAPTLMEELEKVFSAPVIEAYGMTEAAHQIASNPLPPRIRKPASVGLPTGTQVAVLDEYGRPLEPGATGEIAIRGPNVTSGYESNEAANRAAFTGGWFRTGDQGRFDPDGYLMLTGRLKELINRAGEKISPREIDEALLEHPAVAQALAFPIPDARLGEEVGAAVVLAPGASASAIELQKFLSDRLADFKIPRQIVFLDEIPKGPTGKPQRIGLAEKLGLSGGKILRVAAPDAAQPPQTETERRLAAIWSEVLRIDSVSREDDFLALGGDSVLASQVVVRIRERLGVELPLAAFFSCRNLGEQAAMLAKLLENQ